MTMTMALNRATVNAPLQATLCRCLQVRLEATNTKLLIHPLDLNCYVCFKVYLRWAKASTGLLVPTVDKWWI